MMQLRDSQRYKGSVFQYTHGVHAVVVRHGCFKHATQQCLVQRTYMLMFAGVIATTKAIVAEQTAGDG